MLATLPCAWRPRQRVRNVAVNLSDFVVIGLPARATRGERMLNPVTSRTRSRRMAAATPTVRVDLLCGQDYLGSGAGARFLFRDLGHTSAITSRHSANLMYHKAPQDGRRRIAPAIRVGKIAQAIARRKTGMNALTAHATTQ